MSVPTLEPGATAKRNDRRPLFVKELLSDPKRNAKQAAIRAGYLPKSAHVTGMNLMKNKWVLAEIARADAPRLHRLDVTAERVLRELAAIGFADMGDYLDFDEHGGVSLNFAKMPEGATKAIMEVTQETVWSGKGENALPKTITKFKLQPKTPALDLLARHLGILVQKHELSGPDGAPIQIEGAVHFYLPSNLRDPSQGKPSTAVAVLTPGAPE
jgi:phage terminase small subunit